MRLQHLEPAIQSLQVKDWLTSQSAILPQPATTSSQCRAGKNAPVPVYLPGFALKTCEKIAHLPPAVPPPGTPPANKPVSMLMLSKNSPIYSARPRFSSSAQNHLSPAARPPSILPETSPGRSNDSLQIPRRTEPSAILLASATAHQPGNSKSSQASAHPSSSTGTTLARPVLSNRSCSAARHTACVLFPPDHPPESDVQYYRHHETLSHAPVSAPCFCALHSSRPDAPRVYTQTRIRNPFRRTFSPSAPTLAPPTHNTVTYTNQTQSPHPAPASNRSTVPAPPFPAK